MNNYQQLASSLLGSMIPQSQRREIVSVNGIDEARAFTLNSGESIILRDCNEDVIYIKACDDIGKNSFKVYSCVDITDEAVSRNSANGVSKSDFDGLKAELAEVKTMVQEIANGKHNAQRNECK